MYTRRGMRLLAEGGAVRSLRPGGPALRDVWTLATEIVRTVSHQPDRRQGDHSPADEPSCAPDRPRRWLAGDDIEAVASPDRRFLAGRRLGDRDMTGWRSKAVALATGTGRFPPLGGSAGATFLSISRAQRHAGCQVRCGRLSPCPIL